MARNPLVPFRSGGLLGGGGWDPLMLLHRDMNRLFDDVLSGAAPQGASGASGAQGRGSIINAHMNVSETESEVRVAAELPGVAEDDIDVSLDDDVLTIRGEKKLERRDESESFHFVERSYGTFQRSVRLPFPVDPDQVRASFENGVLTVTLPKTALTERTRRIPLQRGGAQMAAGRENGQQQGQDASQPGGRPSGGRRSSPAAEDGARS